MARIAVAAGADGLLVEVHPNPAKAWSDGDQSLDFAEFDDMMASLDPYLALRELGLTTRATGQPMHKAGLPMRKAGGVRPMEAVG
jgi:hypothetical protein